MGDVLNIAVEMQPDEDPTDEFGWLRKGSGSHDRARSLVGYAQEQSIWVSSGTLNPTRIRLVERLEKLVAEYNAGSIDAERFFEALKEFVRSLSEEEQRAAREGLSEDELAIFDLLTNPEPKLTKTQEQEVKRVARQLLEKLHVVVDAIDWVRGQETRGVVWTTIRQRLNDLPEEPYPEALWNAKVEQVWDFVLRRYGGDPSAIIATV